MDARLVDASGPTDACGGVSLIAFFALLVMAMFGSFLLGIYWQKHMRQTTRIASLQELLTFLPVEVGPRPLRLGPKGSGTGGWLAIWRHKGRRA